MLADLRHCHAIGKQPDLRQHHTLTRGHGGLQAVGVVRLDADHLDLRAQVLHVGGDAGDQAAATDRDEDRVQLARVLTQNLHGHGALTGDGVRIVIGVDVDKALFVHQLQRIGQRFRERVTVQHHLATARTHAFDLDLGGGLGHHDGGLDPQLTGRQGHALGMVAGRCGDYATGQFLSTELGQLVIGTANLEGEHRLQVFTLEQDVVAQTLAQLAGGLQRSFDGNVVNARGEDLLDVLFEHRESITERLGGVCESTPAPCRATTASPGF
ncbi:hypothetical protein D3C78_951110 [compost metagenome]